MKKPGKVRKVLWNNLAQAEYEVLEILNKKTHKKLFFKNPGHKGLELLNVIFKKIPSTKPHSYRTPLLELALEISCDKKFVAELSELVLKQYAEGSLELLERVPHKKKVVKVEEPKEKGEEINYNSKDYNPYITPLK